MIHINAESFFLIASLVIISIIIKGKKRGVQVPPLPPGATPWPIVGCVPQIWRSKSASRWIHGLMEQFKSDIICVRLGNVHTIVVKSPEISREFLKKHDAVFASRPLTMATHLVSNGYLTTAFGPKGEQWKKMRRVLHTVFNPSKFQWLLNKRNEEADNLVKLLYKKCSKSDNGSMVNVRHAAQHYTSGVMRKMFFSTNYFGEVREDGRPGFEEERYISSVMSILLHLFGFCVSDYLPWLKPFDIGGHEKTIREALKVIKQHIDPIVDERVRKWRCFNEEKGMKEPIEENLLDVFFSLKDENGHSLLSAEEIKAQIIELLVAALDTPFAITEWALSEMLNQPEMLKKAQEELDRVVGVDKLVQESHLPHLHYITACAKESLRLHPVAPFNVPHVSIDDAIVGGYFIPKGSSLLVSRQGLGRNPKVWENPLKFDPERHLNGDDCKVELEERELNFVTFSIGRRGCPGSKLGTIISLMLFARLLQGFTWSIPHELDKLDLIEAESLFKLNPLNALAKPRLHADVYPVLLVVHTLLASK